NRGGSAKELWSFSCDRTPGVEVKHRSSGRYLSRSARLSFFAHETNDGRRTRNPEGLQTHRATARFRRQRTTLADSRCSAARPKVFGNQPLSFNQALD